MLKNLRPTWVRTYIWRNFDPWGWTLPYGVNSDSRGELRSQCWHLCRGDTLCSLEVWTTIKGFLPLGAHCTLWGLLHPWGWNVAPRGEIENTDLTSARLFQTFWKASRCTRKIGSRTSRRCTRVRRRAPPSRRSFRRQTTERKLLSHRQPPKLRPRWRFCHFSAANFSDIFYQRIFGKLSSKNSDKFQ
jgi:hypothetical protein